MKDERDDKVLVCEECGHEFVWSEEEQVLYKRRGLSQPRICPICRGKKEAEKEFYQKNKRKKGVDL